jgi:hypothetical protein
VSNRPHPLHVTTEGRVLVIKVNLDAYPTISDVHALLQSTSQAPQYAMAALGLLLRAVAAIPGSPTQHYLVAVPAANEKPA